MTALAAGTRRINLGPNVMTTPLRLPAMIAKEAATLDLISDGRVLLGLGAGASDDGIAGLGGPEFRRNGDKFRAFSDALHIIRGLWDSSGEPFSYEGKVLSVLDVQFGPQPARRIPIITGSMGPQSLRLTAKVADGISISTSYVSADRIPWFRQQLDAGAEAFGRGSGELRIYYNVMGFIEIGKSSKRSRDPGVYQGDPSWWIEQLTDLATAGVGGFTLWPVAGNYNEQVSLFAEEIISRVRQASMEAQSS